MDVYVVIQHADVGGPYHWAWCAGVFSSLEAAKESTGVCEWLEDCPGLWRYHPDALGDAFDISCQHLANFGLE